MDIFLIQNILLAVLSKQKLIRCVCWILNNRVYLTVGSQNHVWPYLHI